MSINANRIRTVWQTAPLLNHGWVPRRSVPQPVVDIFKFRQPGLSETIVCTPIAKRFTIARFDPAANDHCLPVMKFLETAAGNVREIVC